MEPAQYKLSQSSLRAQQTPCDTIPVPLNLVVTRLLDTADKPITSGSLSSTNNEEIQPPSAASIASTIAHLGQQTIFLSSLSGELIVPVDEKMHDDTQDRLEDMPLSDSKLGSQKNRKLCVRHRRKADEGANMAMQQVCVPPTFSKR